jgi:sensor histidine kinase YesM
MGWARSVFLVLEFPLPLKMPAALSVGSQSTYRKAPSVAGVVGLWAFVAAAVIAMTTLSISMKSGNVDLLERVIWDIGWMGWAPLTFLVLRICRRHPIDRHRKLPTIARLAVYGMGVVLLQMTIDFSTNSILGLLLRDVSLSWRPLPYIAVYKGHIYYGVYWMIVGAAHAMEFHRRYRESELVSSQLETKLANAELDRLKTQLQPHFLFNAHNTIVSLMLKQENEAAIRMLTRLSDLLRISLSRSGQQLVALREELETLRLYLEIQRERFHDRLSVAIDAPSDLEDAEVPHLLLQPLVENALQHGLEDVTENGRLEVIVAREADSLVLVVRDNGAGFDAKNVAASVSPGCGIGLTNTRDRLQQFYGAQQSLVINRPAGGGCAVTIRIPYRMSVSTGQVTVSS